MIKKTMKKLKGAAKFLPLVAFAAVPEAAWALDSANSVAEDVLGIFTSGLTRTFAIIAVIALGIAALAGKLSWDWAIKIVLGILLIFGATGIVDMLIAGAS